MLLLTVVSTPTTVASPTTRVVAAEQVPAAQDAHSAVVDEAADGFGEAIEIERPAGVEREVGGVGDLLVGHPLDRAAGIDEDISAEGVRTVGFVQEQRSAVDDGVAGVRVGGARAERHVTRAGLGEPERPGDLTVEEQAVVDDVEGGIALEDGRAGEFEIAGGRLVGATHGQRRRADGEVAQRYLVRGLRPDKTLCVDRRRASDEHIVAESVRVGGRPAIGEPLLRW